MILRNGTVYVLTHSKELLEIDSKGVSNLGKPIQSALDRLEHPITFTSYDGTLYLNDGKTSIEYNPDQRRWFLNAVTAH